MSAAFQLFAKGNDIAHGDIDEMRFPWAAYLRRSGFPVSKSAPQHARTDNAVPSC